MKSIHPITSIASIVSLLHANWVKQTHMHIHTCTHTHACMHTPTHTHINSDAVLESTADVVEVEDGSRDELKDAVK